MSWLIVGLIGYFLLKRLVFKIETRPASWEYKPKNWTSLIEKESWTYGKFILAIIACILIGYLTIAAYLIILGVAIFNSNIKISGEHWFNKKSKL